MLPLVGGTLQPPFGLSVQIRIVQERAPVEEALAHIADWSFDLALGLGPVRTASPGTKPPMRGEAQELGVQHQRPFV